MEVYIIYQLYEHQQTCDMLAYNKTSKTLYLKEYMYNETFKDIPVFSTKQKAQKALNDYISRYIDMDYDYIRMEKNNWFN